MSLSRDVVSELKLGDVLEVVGMFAGMYPDEPTLLSLIEVRTRSWRFNVSYLNVRLGTASLTFSKDGPVLTME